MKRLIPILLVLGCTTSLFAQGTIFLDNFNGGGNNHATSFGLFFNYDGTPYTGARINMTLLGGPIGGSLSPIADLKGTDAMYYVGPGVYIDGTTWEYIVPGVLPCSTVTLRVTAWIGTALRYSQAAPSEQFGAWQGSAFVDASTFTFINRTGGDCSTLPVFPYSLDGMPAMQLAIPEPSTITLASVVAAAWLLCRRRKG